MEDLWKNEERTVGRKGTQISQEWKAEISRQAGSMAWLQQSGSMRRSYSIMFSRRVVSECGGMLTPERCRQGDEKEVI